MKHTIYLDGITCDSCIEKITKLFKQTYGITDVIIEKKVWKVIYWHNSELSQSDIKEMLVWTKYSLKNLNSIKEDTFSISTYKPLFTLFWYIVMLCLIWIYLMWDFSVSRFMQYFMAWFFIAFSYFKIINLKEFAMSYSMYDIIAKRWKYWWYVYAYIELWLWISYLIWFHPLITNSITFIVMSVSIIGVIQSVSNKRKIKCACLGAVFDLPMSTITIIEDAVMIGMSGAMILLLTL